jgi:hypothetical protein
MLAGFRVWLAALCLVAARPSFAQQPAPIYGADSPQALVATLEKAMAIDDFAAVMPLISPSGRKELAEDAITALIVALDFMDPDKPAGGGAPVPDAEREAKRTSHLAAVDVARETLKPHGLDGLIGESPISPLSKDVFELALTRTDTVVLMRSLFDALDRIGKLLGIKRGDEKRLPMTFGNVTDFEISGDAATAKADGSTIEFERLQGRWYLKPPDR